MTTMAAAEGLLGALEYLANWTQDLEEQLGIVAPGDPTLAVQGAEYCRQWGEQFHGEEPNTQINFRRTRARCLAAAGEVDAAYALLEESVERWPHELWGWIGLADAWTPSPDEVGFRTDRAKALACLERAKSIPGLCESDLACIEERAAGVRAGTT